MRSRQTLEVAWNNCYRGAGELLLDWWGRFDGILAEMSIIGVRKEDGEKKAKAIHVFNRGRVCNSGGIFRLEGRSYLLGVLASNAEKGSRYETIRRGQGSTYGRCNIREKK